MSFNPNERQEANGQTYTPEQMRQAGVNGQENPYELGSKVALNQSAQMTQNMYNTYMQQGMSMGERGGDGSSVAFEIRRLREQREAKDLMRKLLVLVVTVLVGYMCWTFTDAKKNWNSMVMRVKDEFVSQMVYVLKNPEAYDFTNQTIDKDIQKWEINEFKQTYGHLFADETPYESMFKNCQGRFDCNRLSKGGTDNMLPYAKDKGTVYDQMCTIAVNAGLRDDFWTYKAHLEFAFMPEKDGLQNVCVTKDKQQVAKAWLPIKAQLYGEMVLKVLLPALLTAWLMRKLYPKPEKTVAEIHLGG